MADRHEGYCCFGCEMGLPRDGVDLTKGCCCKDPKTRG